MPSSYTLRMQFGPHEDPGDVTHQLLRLVRQAPVDEVMLFYFGEEQNDGHETLEQLHHWIERSRPYIRALKDAGVQVSLNPWHSMLHCDRGRTLKPGQDWQRMVDPQGRVASAVVCFLDPEWQEYYLESLRMYACEGFRVVWIDDDIRYHNHAPLAWGGCFCPLHVAEFNRRLGKVVTRNEIVRACLSPGKPHPWRAIWMDMWQETILDFLTECRKILETGGTKMGLMSSSMEAHAAEGRRWEEWWQAFGGGKPPVHRPHFWTYSDADSRMLIHGIAALDQNRSIQPAELETGPEIENFPYGAWNKSFRQTFAQMAVGHILGSTNLNISLFDFMGNRVDDEPERVEFLKQSRPVMDWLADNFPMNMRSMGVSVPWSQDLGRLVHTGRGEAWPELQRQGRGWAYWLGAAGVAFSMRAKDAAGAANVRALSGAAVCSFDDATLKRWLAGGVLLDGGAAEILVERGLGKWIGVRSGRMVTQDEVLYSMEACREPDFALRPGAQISVNGKAHAQRMFQGELEGGARIISELLGPRQQPVGHGAFVFENALGGRVAVVPWDASADMEPMMDLHRAAQLSLLARWLASGEPGSVEGGAWLVPQFLSDGQAWRGAAWNAGPDEVETLRVRRPAGMPALTQAWQLSWQGERIAAKIEGDEIRLARPLFQWDAVVFL
jgi:hypothetical protein